MMMMSYAYDEQQDRERCQMRRQMYLRYSAKGEVDIEKWRARMGSNI